MAIPSKAVGYGNTSTARHVFGLTFNYALSSAPKYEAYEVRPGREWLHLQLRELSAPKQRPAFFLSPTTGGYLLMPPGQLALLARRLP